jgi:excisionase family DNA binding protein
VTGEALLTSEEVAELLRVPARTLDRWAYRGEGPPFGRIGRYRRYDPEDLRRWINGRKSATTNGGGAR